MVSDHWDQEREAIELSQTNQNAFEDDSCVKSASHFEQANEFFANLKVLLERATATKEEQPQEQGEHDNNEVGEDRILKKLIGLIDPYQEQPFLLDPHLENMVKPIIELLRTYIKEVNIQGAILSKAAPLGITSNNSNLTENQESETPGSSSLHVTKTMKRLFRLLYYTMKIRGYKTIVKFFTHEVSDLEPTFYFLVAINPRDYDAWETRYVLLIWLSLICMIPFDLRTVDSRALDKDDDKIPLVDHIISLSKFYLNVTGKERDGAAVLLSRLLTRRDIAAAYLTDYVEWATEEAKRNENVFIVIGILDSLCAIYKLGQRSTLLPTVSIAWPCLSLIESNKNFANNMLVRKLLVKLAQRFGLCFLRPKVASWRYKRGNRSLRENLAVTSSSSAIITSKSIDPSNINQTIGRGGFESEEAEEEEEVPEQIEEIIEILLNGLRDRDTIVRWSAAKGIGRIAQRLSQELADDVIGSLLELFSENTFVRSGGVIDMSAVSDYTWHGACLAVAELARRGLLLPKRLNEVITWVSKALKFDLKRGSYSIGSHVRDAACYVCWSFARAYAPEVLAPYVAELANSLVVVSVFDREVNVRRASSAAFQENVGRQGIFPHGIDIITTADYFTVGNRTNAFLEISVKIANFPEYRKYLIDHLSTITVVNWDKQMRELCAQALHNLTRLDVEYMVNTILPRLEIATVTNSVTANAFVDFGSEIICQATAHYVACLARATWPVTNEVLVGWKNVVHDLLGRKDEVGQKIAVRAVEALVEQYGITLDEIDIYLFLLTFNFNLFNNIFFGKIVKYVYIFLDLLFLLFYTYINNAHPSKNRYRRRGYTLALGVLDFPKIPEHLERVIDSLILTSTIQETKPWNDAETRRNAIISLTNIPKKLGSSFKKVANKQIFTKFIEAFFTGFEDYSTDSRGDVGSWIREASILGLASLIPFIVKLDIQGTNNDEHWWTDELTRRVFACLLKQSVERIDRIRTCAGKVLVGLLYEKRENSSVSEGDWLLNMPGRDFLQRVLPRDEEIHWANPQDLYSRMVKLLGLKDYRFELLTGLILAAGGMTESLIRYSSSTLIEYVDSLPLSPPSATSTAISTSITLLDFANSLIEIYRVHERQDRVMLPLLEATDLLFETGKLQKLLGVAGGSNNSEQQGGGGFSFQELFDRTQKECAKSRDVRKISACVKVFCGFVTLGAPYRNKALYQLLGFLVHPFPMIRRTTADQLYLTLTSESVGEEDVEMKDDEEGESNENNSWVQVEDILANTNWDDPIPNLKETRAQLYPILGILPPKVISTNGTTSGTSTTTTTVETTVISSNNQ
ncbi:13041_t:CDS:10 [Ambispora gerdemannii]|uniref:13041_t:CDS:1 n=1 Tax=Ambispora gerdemannii TaxID=144530 RepID=A0A9N8UZU0_9GLOM|nr:13041_t:CDS:10 [Ambispora gerdemannii]